MTTYFILNKRSKNDENVVSYLSQTIKKLKIIDLRLLFLNIVGSNIKLHVQGYISPALNFRSLFKIYKLTRARFEV